MGFPGTFGSPLALSAIEIAIQLALHFRAPFLVAVTAHPTQGRVWSDKFYLLRFRYQSFLIWCYWRKASMSDKGQLLGLD